MNCVFLLLLLRVLCIKANASFGTQSQCNDGNIPNSGGVITRQSVIVSLRAAILLLPLYGLHYLFIVYRPNIEYEIYIKLISNFFLYLYYKTFFYTRNCWLSEVYHYLSLTLDGLQGLVFEIFNTKYYFIDYHFQELLSLLFSVLLIMRWVFNFFLLITQILQNIIV